MIDDLLGRLHELRTRQEPFALATVVRVERPASARPGMKAIVLADGTMEGWVGGSCAHPIVVREALHVLREGAPRLISLSPQSDDRAEQEGVIYHPMTCHGGGSLEIYVEPVLPRPQLVLVGEAPLASALAGLGRIAGFAVWVAEAGGAADQVEADLRLSLTAVREKITPSTYVVVATMGTYDDEALEVVLGAGAAYVGFVASRKRAEAVFASLRDRGVTKGALQQVKVPAGLDIGAVTPEEIAVSIMAELIQVRRSRPAQSFEVPHEARAARTRAAGPLAAGVLAAEPLGAEAIDPVCGMTVEVITARDTFAHRGITYYFCCAHCRQTFEGDPARFVSVGT